MLKVNKKILLENIMKNGTVISDECLEQAKNLVVEIQSGNNDTATKALDELINTRENSLFVELGRLTRDFHDALMGFRLDSRFTDIAETEIPDARDRLNHVIKMTNDSAESTLGAVEESIPVCDELTTQSEELKEKWLRFQRKEMQADEFRELSGSMSDYFSKTISDATSIKENLNKVLMAQSFQDLTGQIIKQVITLVDEVENNLVNLVKLSSNAIAHPGGVENKKTRSSLDGPQIPGNESATSVSGQDEVDDLLSSLGF